MGEAREFLKRETASRHRRLDVHPLVAGLAAGTLEIGIYGRMLAVYRDFYATWEEAIPRAFPREAVELGGDRFQKNAWLEEDLSALGAIPLPPASPAFPVPTPATRAQLAGCLYVVEGSTLGGMHLARAGTLPGRANRFFRGYGEATVEKWRSFLSWLEPTLTHPADREAAALAAGETFDWFQHGFEAIVPAASSSSEGPPRASV